MYYVTYLILIKRRIQTRKKGLKITSKKQEAENFFFIYFVSIEYYTYNHMNFYSIGMLLVWLIALVNNESLLSEIGMIDKVWIWIRGKMPKSLKVFKSDWSGWLPEYRHLFCFQTSSSLLFSTRQMFFTYILFIYPRLTFHSYYGATKNIR